MPVLSHRQIKELIESEFDGRVSAQLNTDGQQTKLIVKANDTEIIPEIEKYLEQIGTFYVNVNSRTLYVKKDYEEI